VIVAVVGPTASGKTAAALALAERLGLEVVSCDSMQIYRGFDVGTAKPSASERARVRHHLIDVADPDETFSAARFVTLAEAAIAQARTRGHGALVVGGTGLYLRALRFGLFDAPSRDDALRERLYAEEAARPGTLRERLAAVDPASAARIAPRDLLRLVRALEVHQLTGRSLSAHFAAHDRAERHRFLVALLDPPTHVLRARIIERTAAMLRAGLIEETKGLVDRYGRHLRPLGAVGYREVVAYLTGELRAPELEAAIVTATLQYARRQRTWWKREPGALRFGEGEALFADVARQVEAAGKERPHPP
jgi:tRNA dimethylallyltransferase